MPRIAVVEGLRTPFCKMETDLAEIAAQDLGTLVTRELIERLDVDPSLIREVIFGNVAQPPEAANISRVIALQAGLPITTPAYTVQRNCASGLEALFQATIKIRTDEGQCYIAGGTESMTRIPLFAGRSLQKKLFRAAKAKTAQDKLRVLASIRPSDLKLQSGLIQGLTDGYCGLNMGQTAEILARDFGIPRRRQDEFALMSHHRATAARELLREEIMPVFIANQNRWVTDDNGPREGQTIEALQRLKPVFDRYGTVTAGNASQVTDGAVALLICQESVARAEGWEPLGYVRAFAVSGVEPQRMGLGPSHAIALALRRAGVRFDQVQAFEINEAFAAQVLAVLDLMKDPDFIKIHGYENYSGEIPLERLNVNGGAIALGHPVGATGARLVLTLLKHMKRHDLNLGVAALCIGGGQGAAVVLER